MEGLVIRALLALFLFLPDLIRAECNPELMARIAEVTGIVDTNNFQVARELHPTPFARHQSAYSDLLWLGVGRKAGVTLYVEEPEFHATLPTEEYLRLMPLEFEFRAQQLKKGQVAIDLGAGTGAALIPMIESGAGAKIIGISKYKPVKSQLIEHWHGAVDNLEEAIKKYPEQFEYREMDLDAVASDALPKADLLIDVVGWLTYTHQLQHGLETVHHTLRNEDAVFHLALPANSTFFYEGDNLPKSQEAIKRLLTQSPKQFKNFEAMMRADVHGLAITHSNTNVLVPDHTDAYRIVQTKDPFSAPRFEMVYLDPMKKVRVFKIISEKRDPLKR